MTIVSRAECGPEQWDQVVAASPDAWVWALWKWQELILSVPRWQLTDASFAVVDGGRVVAVVPLQWSGDRTRLSGSGFGLTSPAVTGEVSADDRDRYRAMVFDHVELLAHNGGAQRLEFALCAVSGAALAAPDGTNPFVRFGFDDESSQARVLDLRADPDSLFAQCSKDTRQQIKRARAAGVTARRADWLESLDDYYALHSETYSRTGVPPHPREYFEGIATHLGPAGHSVLWGAYDAGGRPIAFHNSARLGPGAMYHTGCSAGVALENGANYLVFWESILDAKAHGAVAYEIGEVFPGADGKKSGLTTFKSKFGGATRPLFRAGMTLARNIVPSPPAHSNTDPPPAGSGVVGGIRESLRATRRMSERLIGPAITNAAARTVVAGARALRDGPRPRASRQSPPPAPPPGTIRFFRPFWDDAEAEAVRRPISATARLERERILAAEIRRIEQFEDDAEVVFASSGRGALLGALQIFAAKQPSRRSVIIQSYSCKGLLDAVVNAGLTPRFVDVDADFNADQTAAWDAVDDDVLAIVAVHLAGQRFAHEDLLARARARGVFVIEDKAHAFGSGWHLESDAVIYSFGLGKSVMATAGGAVVGRVHADEFAQLRAAMQDERAEVAIARYEYARDAFSTDVLGAGGYPASLRPNYGLSKLNAVDAALLEQQLLKAATIVSRRRAHATAVVARLRAYPDVFHIQSGTGGHAYTKLMVELQDPEARDRFLNHMSQRGIEMEWMYVPLHTRDFGRPYQTTPLPNTERLDGTVVNVPVRPDLSGEEVQRIATAIAEFATSERGVAKTAREIEAETRAKYSGAIYQPQTISVMPAGRPAGYAMKTLALKLDLIREYCNGDPLLDVCCSTGLQLQSLAPGRRMAIGVDFSMPFLEHATGSASAGVRVVCGNARALPFRSGAIGAAYSLSSLYHIPDVAEVIAEIGRVLRPGGRCLLDMGNRDSLNNIVCRAYPELAAPCHVPVAEMLRMIDAAGLKVLVHRKFQILPMWGDRPSRIKWLMSPRLITFMSKTLGNRMLDEWVSSLPLLRNYAFRQVFVCERVDG